MAINCHNHVPGSYGKFFIVRVVDDLAFGNGNFGNAACPDYVECGSGIDQRSIASFNDKWPARIMDDRKIGLPIVQMRKPIVPVIEQQPCIPVQFDATAVSKPDRLVLTRDCCNNIWR